MKHARWLDHLPLWAVYGAVARTGIYEPWEILFMAAPLALAALVELLRRDLSRWRVPLELAVLGWTALDLFIHPGFFGALVRLLFLLGGLRLALPRQPAQRRQLLLIGFLLFLTTAISNSDLEFFAWTLVWMFTATGALLQQAWEAPAALRPGPTARPPFRLVPLWGAGALLMAGGFFLLLPRLNTGWRPFPSFSAALGKLQAGLSDQVDLSQPGAIEGNHEVVMRVVPPEGLSPEAREALGRRLAYLRGLALERVDGQRWDPEGLTPWPPVELGNQQSTPDPGDGVPVELFLNPTPRGVVPLPYGTRFAATPFAARLRRGEGGSYRVPFPLTQGVPIRVLEARPGPGDGDGPAPLEDPRPPSGGRLAELLELQPEHEAARRASLAWAPGFLRAPDLAAALAAKLRTFTYTLDNPCGTAPNPLEAFLDRTQAGHCEYFASALALMLRSRGVPARVVNGYRLGAWVPEGGYWLVTQDEAHAWVEYWDGDSRLWRLADGTPPLTPTAGSGLSGAWTRFSDALTFRWNRYVVRYSGEDQAAGLSVGLATLKGAAKGWSWRWKRPSPWAIAATLLLAGAWAAWRLRRRARAAFAEPRGSRALAPLLRRVRKVAPPESGETARRWLSRLALLRPDRSHALAELADAVDQALYGGAPEAGLRPRVRAEAKAWRTAPGG